MALALPVVGSAFSPCLTSRSWFRKSAAPSTNGRLSASYKASESSSGNVELPNGVYWLDRAAHNHDVVYGQVRAFMMSRHSPVIIPAHLLPFNGRVIPTLALPVQAC